MESLWKKHLDTSAQEETIKGLKLQNSLKNGKAARQNEAVLEELVSKFLMKGSWELVSEEEVTNVLPLHLVPKEGASPPWRLICDARALNEHIKPWKFRMESLKLLPMVLKPNDVMFTLDLEGAYYSVRLLEESRNLMAAKLKLTAATVER